jgi:hypothetical protein
MQARYSIQLVAIRVSLDMLILARVAYRLLRAGGKRTMSSAMDKFSCREIY